MSHNLEYLLTRPGLLKMISVIFGICAFGLSANAYTQSPYTKYYEEQTEIGNNGLPTTILELCFVTITGGCLGLSFAYLALYSFIYELCESKLNRIVDTAFHFISSLVLFGGASVALYAAVRIDDFGCSLFGEVKNNSSLVDSVGLYSAQKFCHYFGQKIVATCFALLNSFLYCWIGIVAYTTTDL